MKQRAARRIGALDRPGDKAADQERHHRGADGVDQRVADQAQDVSRRIGFGEILQREGAEAQAGVFGERGQQQGCDRHQHQPGADCDADDEKNIRTTGVL